MSRPRRVLTVNTGSSSVKLRLLDDSDSLVAGADPAIADTGDGPCVDRGELAGFLESAGRVDAVGHRVVHGGPRYAGPAVLDRRVRRELAELAPLAPGHQPLALNTADAVAQACPGAPAVACFDTAFHADLPAAAATYALPEDLRDRYGLRKYGFHGLSHGYAAARAAELTGDADQRAVVCHLGSGASLAAVRGGRSVDTTMGFTPLDGLVMHTRSGSVDPGMLLWLQRHRGLDAATLDDALQHRSGLLGLSGRSDMREVVGAGDDRARLALDVYLHRLRAGIGAMAAALGGLDVLVFTGGVGEHGARVREGATQGLGFLGVLLDAGANHEAAGDRDVGAAGAPVRCLVVEAREDIAIAGQTRDALAGAVPGSAAS